MTGPAIIRAMILMRRDARRRRCRVKTWRFTEVEAFTLADWLFEMQSPFGPPPYPSRLPLFEALTRGEMRMFDANILVKPSLQPLVDSRTWTGR